MDIHIYHHFEGLTMADLATLETKLTELTAAVTANGERTATQLAALQAALDQAKADAVIPDADIAALQAAIDALNAGATPPTP